MAARTLDTPLGRLLLVSDGSAISRITWSDTPAADPDPLLDEAAEQLLAYLSGRLRCFDLPVAPAGTDFQRRIWRAMQAIPYGRTRTYGALARDTGSVARAVGGACGANPIPIVIPCHRVLAAQGLGGYSGGLGLESKRALLRLEGVLSGSLW